MALPQLTDEQRAAALAKAAQARKARAELKERLKRGGTDLQQVLKDAARGQFEAMDRSRISVILGVTSAQELLFSMVSRLQRPVWLRALREAGIAVDNARQKLAALGAAGATGPCWCSGGTPACPSPRSPT